MLGEEVGLAELGQAPLMVEQVQQYFFSFIQLFKCIYAAALVVDVAVVAEHHFLQQLGSKIDPANLGSCIFALRLGGQQYARVNLLPGAHVQK